MHKVLGHDLEPNVLVYMDDILILANSIRHMFELLLEVAKRLTNANLSINIQKSKFFAKQVRYLGFILDTEGLRSDPRNSRS